MTAVNENFQEPDFLGVLQKWDIQQEAASYLEFLKLYRKIRSLPMGGTRTGSYKYPDLTSQAVLSVGVIDDRGQLPFRIALSTFKLSHPITSYGCIVRHKSEEGWSYLLIKRTDTVEYAELLRGGYRESQLYFFLRNLTLEERERLLKYDFDTLWTDHMGALFDNDIYRWSKQMFARISSCLKEILVHVPSTDPMGHNQWLFPKGRLEYRALGFGLQETVPERSRTSGSDYEISELTPVVKSSPGKISRESTPNYRSSRESTPTDQFRSIDFVDIEKQFVPESPWECAEREFREETNNLDIGGYKFVLSDPIQEVFFGSNGKNYASSYFVLDVPEMSQPIQFPKRTTPIREVSLGEAEEILWVPSQDLHKYLPPLRLELIRKLEAQEIRENVQLSPIWFSPVDPNELVDDTLA